ncbi:MAG: beta-lactamase family protein, partial [Candidatus Eisenbacteria bacterium]|nr:beta-lactamase family protein [Candidatus Eisenbacteria bacterium]
MKRGIAVVLLLCAAGWSGASEPATPTDEPAFPKGLEGERFELLIKAVNSRDMGLARRFYEEQLTDEYREELSESAFLQAYQWFASSTGGVDFYGVRTYDPPRSNETTVICRDLLYGSFWGITFSYGDDPGTGITHVRFNAARVPAAVVAAKIDAVGLAEELDTVLDRVCSRGLFSGTVLIARGNDVIYEHACGEASKAFHAPVDRDTKFNVGSLNKMFTAVAIAQLAEQGRLSYDDPVSAFLDESWLPAAVAEKITIHQLLTHTSGLGDYFSRTFETGSRKRFRTVDEFKELVSDSLRFEPGTDWGYSDTGFLLLGAVIESVTGRDYFDYIREYVYGPAGMGDTDCYDMDCPIENLAIGYWRSTACPRGWKNNIYLHVIRGGPAGGGFSTAPDLHRFTQALASGALVSGDTIARMWTDYREGDRAYGYGFMLR